MGKQSRQRREKFALLQQQRRVKDLEKQGRVFDYLTQRAKDSYNHHIKVWNETGEFVDYILPFTRPVNAVISGQNVYDYCAAQGVDYTNPSEWDFTGITPPFDDVFIECKHISLTSDYGWFGDFGCLIHGIEVEDEKLYVALEVYTCWTGWEVEYDEEIESSVGWVYLDLQGNIVGYDSEFWHGGNRNDRFLHAAYVALKTIQFMNCRNTELIENTPDPAMSREYQHHFGAPLTRYKTLRINPIRKVYDTERESNGDSVPKSLHIVRGHFAKYTDDKPLFGKYTGTFWIPAHVRGDEKRGIVVKDYAVDTGEKYPALKQAIRDNAPELVGQLKRVESAINGFLEGVKGFPNGG